MSIQIQTRERVRQIPAGAVFEYRDLPSYGQSPTAAVKAVSRLLQRGELRRLSKGKFYRPEQGVLGERKLSESEKLKSLLYRNGRCVGYVTGARLYNRMGLTTQVPRAVTIAWEGSRQKRVLGALYVNLVRTRAPVSKQNLRLLELLDALKDIRRISDAPPSQVLDVLTVRIRSLDDAERAQLVRLSVAYYPPASRALLGLVLDVWQLEGAESLRDSLNPLTRYKVGLGACGWAKAAGEWNIR